MLYFLTVIAVFFRESKVVVSANISSGVTKNPDQENFLESLKKNLAVGRQVIAKPTPKKELNKAISLDIEIPPKKTKQNTLGINYSESRSRC